MTSKMAQRVAAAYLGSEEKELFWASEQLLSVVKNLRYVTDILEDSTRREREDPRRHRVVKLHVLPRLTSATQAILDEAQALRALGVMAQAEK